MIWQRKPGHLAVMIGGSLRMGVSLGLFDSCQEGLRDASVPARILINVGIGAILGYVGTILSSYFLYFARRKQDTQFYEKY